MAQCGSKGSPLNISQVRAYIHTHACLHTLPTHTYSYYVHLDIHIPYTCMSTHTYSYYVHLDIYVHTYSYTNVHLHLYIYTYIHTYIHTYIQMVACLGQQSVGGARIQNGFLSRTLPHFPVGSLEPNAKGFVVRACVNVRGLIVDV